jgi:predicted Zn finger-like uncharacterized protein
MFTQCPDCRKTYPLTTEQLCGNKLLVFCSDCGKDFNALELLNEKSMGLVAEAKAEFIGKADPKPKSKSEKKDKDPQQAKIKTDIDFKENSPDDTAVSPPIKPSAKERVPWEIKKTPVNVLWFVGVVIGSLLLLGQIIFFESGKLSQNSSYRPRLEKLCHWLGCQLQDYQNLNEFVVLKGSFTPGADNTMVFKAVINNQAAFKQRLPNIKLTLLDYNEQIFAQRIFVPKEYLPNTAHPNYSIAPDETVAASLTIAVPKTSVGGYNFDLIY